LSKEMVPPRFMRKKEVLQENCSICIHRNPVIYDDLVGDLVEEQKDVDRYEDVRKIEAMTEDQKWNYILMIC
jgi:formate dehydrogenase (coenzyme F420) beta subunit